MLSPPEPSVWSGNVQVSYGGILALVAPVKQLRTSTFKQLSDRQLRAKAYRGLERFRGNSAVTSFGSLEMRQK